MQNYTNPLVEDKGRLLIKFGDNGNIQCDPPVEIEDD